MNLYILVTFSDEITLGTFVVIAIGFLFAGYFGFRDKSWRNSAAGWKDSFELEQKEHHQTKEHLIRVETELTALRAQPDLSGLTALLIEHDKEIRNNQHEILQLIQDIARILQMGRRGDQPQP